MGFKCKVEEDPIVLDTAPILFCQFCMSGVGLLLWIQCPRAQPLFRGGL